MQNELLPRLYGILKLLEEHVPWRPTITHVELPTHDLSKYLANLLKPFAETTIGYIVCEEFKTFYGYSVLTKS